ncbi:MAG: TraB/GumN family protein [Bacteroidaceae bacterium]|nr:TraB/GumN family protein [Bacteroidaceae bacterium]
MKKLLTIVLLIQMLCLGCNAQEQGSFHEHQGVFFRISGNGLTNPSYILGTIHTIPGDFVHTLPNFSEIIGSVGQFVTEYNFEEQYRDMPYYREYTREEWDSQYRHIMSLYQRKDGSMRPLIDDLSSKNCDIVKAALNVDLGFRDKNNWTFEYLNRNAFKEYLRKELELINSLGYNFQVCGSPVDTYLMDSIAPAYHLPIIGLDKKNACKRYTKKKKEMEQYWGVKTKRKTYSKMIGDLIINYYYRLKGSKEFCQNYLNGNNVYVKNIKSKPGEMKERNAWWMEQLPALMQDKPSFIAVGIAHLMDGVDYRGILPQLEEMGYTIERIK